MSKTLKCIPMAMLLLIVFVLAACSSDKNTSSDGEQKSSSDSSSSGTTTASVDLDLPKITFKLAHITPTDHMWHKASEKFNEELKARSGGKMQVEIYPASQLGTEADMVQQVEAGSIDFALITGAYLSARTPEMAAWFAPYAFDSLQDAYNTSQSDIGKEVLSKVEGTGLKGLDYLFAGQRVMILKNKEVKQASDLSGLKMRVTPSPPLTAFYKSTGAAPEALPLPEVYSAIQTGVIDGMDMDLDATITNKYSEVAKYAAVTNHMVWPSVIITNEKSFDGLSKDAQQIIIDSLKVASLYAVENRAAQEEDFKSQLTSQGMEVFDLDASVFKSQIEAFDAEYSAQSELIKRFIETVRK
ncbi:TRAP transporter substrate-binding protein [Solibacillus sp. CAU 1738]|uniref:TRAP transporter substrate-binding protein n=1 Tax=Solibacillus sp. CAU 1738 TaxID=3140363 RepID=UPI0032604ED0